MGTDKKILFIINGFGLGNYSRCLPLIRQLAALGFKIDVCSSGHAYDFIQSESAINQSWQLERLSYPIEKGKLNFSQLIQSIPSLIGKFLKNRRQIQQILSQDSYQLVVSDSDYSLLAVWNKPRHIAMNNAYSVIQFYKSSPIPASLRKQFLVEKLDWLVHRLMADHLICPTFEINLPPVKALSLCPPILRHEFFCPSPKNQEVDKKKTIVLMLSSSGLTTSLHFWKEIDFETHRVITLGSPLADAPAQVEHHPLTPDNIALLKAADYLLINAGQGSIGEALALNIPTIIFPLEQHAEQWANANQASQFANLRIYRSDLPLQQQLASIEKWQKAPFSRWEGTAKNIILQQMGFE